MFLDQNNQQTLMAATLQAGHPKAWGQIIQSLQDLSASNHPVLLILDDLDWVVGENLRGLEMASGKILGILRLCDTLTDTCLKGIPILNSQGSSSEESWWWSLPHDRLQIRLELYGINHKYPFSHCLRWVSYRLGFQKKTWEALQT